MNSLRHHITLKHRKSDVQFHLWRLTDEEYEDFRETSSQIRRDSSLFLWLFLSERDDPERLNLAKAFLALEHLFGASSKSFDRRKGSFSFPLLLVLERPTETFFYLLRVFDRRGEIEYDFYRIVLEGSELDNIYHEPYEQEFSSEEINLFICYFQGYLTGIASWFCKQYSKPFMKSVASSNILYGYRDGEFFEENYESTEECDRARQKFLDTYGSGVVADKAALTKSLLAKITRQEMNHA